MEKVIQDPGFIRYECWGCDQMYTIYYCSDHTNQVDPYDYPGNVYCPSTSQITCSNCYGMGYTTKQTTCSHGKSSTHQYCSHGYTSQHD